MGPLQASDDELVKRAVRGDARALDAIVDRYAQTLFNVASSMLSNRADAEDAVQETFLGAVAGLSGFQQRSSLKTWLIRILVNQVSKVHRGRSMRLRDEQVASEREGSGWFGSSAVEVERKADVKTMLMTLSSEFREVLVLRELEGMSYEEIAAVLDVPQGTVESRIHRARKQLRERFEGYMQ